MGLRDSGGGPVDTGRGTRAVKARTRLYRGGRLALEDFAPGDISDYLDKPDTLVWLDLCEPDQADLQLITEEFGLHQLAIEDALSGHQRPKVDRYPSHLFVTMYAVHTDASATLCVFELSVFVMDRALVTVRRSDQIDIDAVCARWDVGADELGSEGVGFLLHGLLDVIVDGHTTTLQRLDDDLESLDDVLFTDNRADIDLVQRRSYELRKDLLQLRRVVVPMRDALVDLMKRDTNLVTDRLQPYYQDVYDHSLRAAEGADALRDLVHTLLETNMMVQANRMNLVMKKVTSWAAIVAVPTLITGFFGQNLPFPGFERSSGFALSSALIVGLAALLYVAFRRWEWL